MNNNNKVLKSKKPFFTINKKVVMFLGFIVVVGAVLGALYGTGVIGSSSDNCDKNTLINEILKEKEQYPDLIKKDRLFAANCEELKKFKDLTDSEKKLMNNSMKLIEGSIGLGDCSDLSVCQNKLKTELNTKHPNVKLSDCNIKYYTCKQLEDLIKFYDNLAVISAKSKESIAKSKESIAEIQLFTPYIDLQTEMLDYLNVKYKKTPEDKKSLYNLINKLKPDMSENEIKQIRQEFEAIKNNAK